MMSAHYRHINGTIGAFTANLLFLIRHSRASLLGALSSAFEWYDYALFGYFTTVIAHLFFPSTDPITALLSSFAVFASGFAMRPLGAIIFGYIGDRVGRRHALVLSLALMALPTVFLGLLPTYEHIGIWATYALVLLRLLQGLAVGGNYGGSFIVTIENAPKGYQALAGSLATFGTLGGLFLGSSAVFLATTYLTESDLYQFGWRIPFLLGGFSGLVAYMIRHFIPDEPSSSAVDVNTHHVLQHDHIPIRQIWQHHRNSVLKAIGIILIDGVGIYLALVFMATYATVFLKLPASYVLAISAAAMALLVVCIPFFGYLGDMKGARRILRYVSIGFLILSLPLYLMLIQNPTIGVFAILQIVFAILIAAAYGVLPVTVVGLFPKNIRYTATGLAFNRSVAAFGGTAPLIIPKLIDTTGALWIPGAALMLVGMISFFCLIRCKEDYL